MQRKKKASSHLREGERPRKSKLSTKKNFFSAESSQMERGKIRRFSEERKGKMKKMPAKIALKGPEVEKTNA